MTVHYQLTEREIFDAIAEWGHKRDIGFKNMEFVFIQPPAVEPMSGQTRQSRVTVNIKADSQR